MTKPELLSRTIVYESSWVNLYLDEVRFPNGHVIEQYHLLDFPHASVGILMENASGEVMFVRISRYPTGLTEWELPAGGIEPDETEIEAARREVLEETGYTSEAHQVIYSYYPINNITNQLFHLVRCRAGERVQDFDPNEVSQTHWFTKEEVRELIRTKALTDGLTLTALLFWLQESSAPLLK
ncbi:MAG TPA: NUDIX hydrolase [Anaerolineales bacterium]|nr:NUDIX hydrolase [Anaerolineales bacterium]